MLRVDFALALGRNAQRSRPVPADVVERMWRDVEQLTAPVLLAEGFAEVDPPPLQAASADDVARALR